MPKTVFSRRALLGASVWGLGFLPLAGMIARPAAAAGGGGIAYGWDSGVEGPRAADVHVAPDGADDAPGTADRPVATIRRGVELLAARPSGSLAIRGGIYREAVSLNALRGATGADGRTAYRIHRHGAERVTITAAEPLRGWAPCDPAEAAQLGLSPEGIYVARLPAGSILHGDLLALNLHEAGVWCPVVSIRRQDAGGAIFNFRTFRPGQFHVAGSDETIRAIRDPALAGWSRDRLRDARVLVYHAPNAASSLPIQDFDPETGTIHLPPEPVLRMQRTSKDPQTFYALQNVPAQVGPGEWFARHEGETVAIWFRPRSPDALERGIEVTLRDHCIDLGAAQSVEIFGIEMVRAGGSTMAQGSCLRRVQGGQGGRDIRLIHCRAGENICTEGRGYGAIYLHETEGLVVSRCTVEDCRASFGLFLSGCRRSDLRGLHIRRVSQSPARFFAVNDLVLAFSLFEESGRDAHANKFNFYLGSDQILVYGVRTRDTDGYATYQQASRIHFAFCEFDCAPAAANRALVSQNYPPKRGGPGDGTGDPVPGSTFWYWNLALVPDPSHLGDANSLVLGPQGGTHRHVIHNCVLHGGGYGGVYTKEARPDREERSYNRYTGLSFWQSAEYGWRLGEGEMAQRPLRAPQGQGLDMRRFIQTEIAPLFPNFQDWDRDIDGRAVNWAAPPIGPRA